MFMSSCWSQTGCVRCSSLSVLLCWSSGLLYWSPGDQLTSLAGPDPGSPSASLSADDRRIVGIQPQGSPSLIPGGLILPACALVCPPPSFLFIFTTFFRGINWETLSALCRCSIVEPIRESRGRNHGRAKGRCGKVPEWEPCVR